MSQEPVQPESEIRTALPVGSVLHRAYRVEEEVANGGFGIVYRARHQETGVQVAVKEYFPIELAVRGSVRVHPRHAECRRPFSDGLRRFLVEAKQLVAFEDCPNIVSFRDFFRENGTAYMVMDFEDGMSLSLLLAAREAQGRPFDESEMLGVVVPLMKGLEQVHAEGTLHRDIKPGNIIIRREVSEESQRPVLIDFGAAKQALGEYSKSFAPYTDGYAAIEQVGEGQLGPWTDIYAMGAVMWRIVAGGDAKTERPIPVKVENRASRIIQGRPDPLRSAHGVGAGRFSSRVLDAVDKCLRLPESERFQDCEGLRKALVPDPAEVEPRRHMDSTPAAGTDRGKPKAENRARPADEWGVWLDIAPAAAASRASERQPASPPAGSPSEARRTHGQVQAKLTAESSEGPIDEYLRHLQDKVQAKLTAESGEGVHIPPWFILAGLSKFDRSALCTILALFNKLSVANKAIDQYKDWRSRRSLERFEALVREGGLTPAGRRQLRRALEKRQAPTRETGQPGDPRKNIRPTFELRVQEEASRLERSNVATSTLRFRLWMAIRSRLKLRPAVPLSTSIANARAAEVAAAAARHFRRDGERRFPRKAADFGEIVREEVKRAVLAALDGEGLSDEERQKVANEFQRKLRELPEDLRDASLEQAVTSGNWAVAASLVSAGSLAGLGVAVEVAGFSAYILAAKASAVIPFLSGTGAVSALAVLSNPLFIVPAMLGGLALTNKALKGKILRPVASAVAVQLAVHGLSAGNRGLKDCLDGFKQVGEHDLNRRLRDRRRRVGHIVGKIPETPGEPDVKLPTVAATGLADRLSAVLYPSRSSPGAVPIATAGIASADLLFDAAAIDPHVVAAADFSSSEQLGDIFRFGAFAEHVAAMSEAAQAGAKSALRGYVGEMMVASRLAGHEVSLPETPNNAGYDLLVDGHPFQVKCYGSSDGALDALGEHFDKHPDIPVYVNSEVMPAVQRSGEPWAGQVFTVEGYD